MSKNNIVSRDLRRTTIATQRSVSPFGASHGLMMCELQCSHPKCASTCPTWQGLVPQAPQRPKHLGACTVQLTSCRYCITRFFLDITTILTFDCSRNKPGKCTTAAPLYCMSPTT